MIVFETQLNAVRLWLEECNSHRSLCVQTACKKGEVSNWDGTHQYAAADQLSVRSYQWAKHVHVDLPTPTRALTVYPRPNSSHTLTLTLIPTPTHTDSHRKSLQQQKNMAYKGETFEFLVRPLMFQCNCLG